YHLQRPGLLLMNGVVYAAFGGHCDIAPYRGWVVGINGTSGATTARWTDEALIPPSLPEVGKPGGGIWQAGGRLVSDTPGDILLVSGNGQVPPAPLPGSTPPPRLGEAAIRLHVQAGGTLQANDFWAPCNAQDLSDTDQDIGSGAPLALPNSFGTPAVPHVLVVVGKEGPTYLLNRDHLGGQSGDSFGYGSSSAIVTSDGTTSGSALVWVTYWPVNPGQQQNAELRAYDANPTGGVLTLRGSWSIGTGNKFTTPTVHNGRM